MRTLSFLASLPDRIGALWSREALDDRRLMVRMIARIAADDVLGRSAQLSYYFLLALFPLLVFLFALVGLVFRAEAGLQTRALDYLDGVMPPSAFNIVAATARDLTRGGGSGAKLSAGLLLALWLASSGMRAVINGLNVAYRSTEGRSWWQRRILAVLLTLGMSIGILGSLGLILLGGRLGDRMADALGLGAGFEAFWAVVRWVTAAVLLLSSITLLYRLAPNPSRGRPRAYLPGALVAVAGWFGSSWMLRWYLRSFASLGATYGSVAAVIALLIWLYLTGAVLLLGGVLNSEIRMGRDRW